MSAEVEGITGEEVEFLMVLRKIEDMWRQDYIGRMWLDFRQNRTVVLRFEHTFDPERERRKPDSERSPDDRRKT